MSMYLPNIFPMVLNVSPSKQIETSVEVLPDLVVWLGFLLLFQIKHSTTQIHLTQPHKLWVIFENIFLNQGLSQKRRCRIHLHRNSRRSNPFHVRDPLLMELVIHGFWVYPITCKYFNQSYFCKDNDFVLERIEIGY